MFGYARLQLKTAVSLRKRVSVNSFIDTRTECFSTRSYSSGCMHSPSLFRRTPIFYKPEKISKVKQEPLFPGKYRKVLHYQGEHEYDYGQHTRRLFSESKAFAVIPGGCLLYWVLTWFPNFPVVSWEMQLGYLAALCLLSRFVAHGRRNKVVKNLLGKNVVLTGGTSGVGKATAAQLVRMGANVQILSKPGLHAEQTLKYLENLKKDESQMVEFVPLDLADFIAVREYCKKARREARPIDLLINNAGVIHVHQVLTRFGDDEQLAINFLGPYLLTEGLLPLVEEASGRIVNVSCSAHVAVQGQLVQTYLSGRGVWSPRVAEKFDGLEQFGFTKLGNIYHAQELSIRSYPLPPKQKLSARLVAQKDPKLKAATPQVTPAEAALQGKQEAKYTTCSCSPGGVATNLYRNVPFADVCFSYLRYALLLMMRTPHEGSQTVINCCLRDELYNGGYYMNCKFEPSGLSASACDTNERDQVMAWAKKKMSPYMKWD